MTSHPIFRTLWRLANLLILVAAIALVYCFIWEFSTRKYLEGFADAVVPLSATTEEKVEAILVWMDHGPKRRSREPSQDVSLRDPRDTLNYHELLRVCGTATNAFLNLAFSSGLEARRLLLLGPEREAMHVAAEVRIGDRWVVVEPLYRATLRDAAGRLLTKEELRDPAVWKEATSKIPGFSPDFTYELTAHVRAARIPIIGSLAGRVLDRLRPGWDSAVNWSLFLERRSFALTLAAGFLLMLGVVMRFVLAMYGERRLKIARVRARDQFLRVCAALFQNPS